MSWQELGHSTWGRWSGQGIQIVSLQEDNYLFRERSWVQRYNPAWLCSENKNKKLKQFHIKRLCVAKISSTVTFCTLFEHQSRVLASRLLRPTLIFWLSLHLCMRQALARVWVGAVVQRMGSGVLPAVLNAPDCLCTGRMKQAPAGRGAVKRITPALTYPCMVYHPVAKYSYCIWQRRTTTTSKRSRRWIFGTQPRSYSPYFETF